MCTAVKGFCKHLWVHCVEWKSLILAAFWCGWSFNWAVCYKADPERNIFNEPGLCWADLQRDRTGRDEDAHCWIVLPFLEEAWVVLSLAWRRQKDGKLEQIRTKWHLLDSHLLRLNASEKLLSKKLSYCTTTTPGSSFPFPQSFS